ncbi:MAG: hypothetical protein OM95_07560 [Bdellovibrio sp. ArHS]|uniref:DUF4442 domain-containing protein n=1 Tax=Bdellovibrio sp. ArHS TaxID=1569284 RepID=UPI0005836F0B|nr:DUF4442 domain-containing protein [Bdellovibrio sp. ArHS]KHD88654.1 MAG: hypothetical protein OM95_07560 [Bdellovibrio sp. ArHS]
MNQQWLTILMSKGIELEQNLRQQLQTAKDELKTQLESRGIRLSAADLAALLEDVSPKASHAALSYALDIVRPFSAGMGLRISRLSDTQVEMVIPARTRNMSESNNMHEGALTTAAAEAAKVLWMRHAPVGSFEVSVARIEAEFFKNQTEDCRIRMELPETTREMVLSALRDHREAKTEAELKIFDDNEQAVAEIRLQLNFKHTPALAGQE